MKFIKKAMAIACAAAAMLGLCACNNTPPEEQNPPKEEKVLMVGDSLFDLWKANCDTDLAGAKNLTNIAVGGTNCIYWTQKKEQVRQEDPTVILMSLGTNDISGDGLGKTGKEAAEGDGKNYGGLQGVLNTFHEVCPDAYIYLLTVNICGETMRWDAREEIRTCNRLMREYCKSIDWAEMVETENAFYDDEDYTKKPNSKYFSVDYLHFSAKGYQVLSKIIREAMGLSAAENPSTTNPSDNKPSQTVPVEKEEKVVMMGDSLFDLWKSGCGQALAGAKNLTNIAIGGTTAAYWIEAFQRVSNEKPTKLIISIGTNDILTKSGRTAATGRAGIQDMLEFYHEKFPDVKIHLLTINICGENDRWNKREEVVICNNLMRTYCEGKDWAEMVETEHLFYDDDDYTQKPNPEYFEPDYLHFSQKGYQKLAPVIRKALKLD